MSFRINNDEPILTIFTSAGACDACKLSKVCHLFMLSSFSGVNCVAFLGQMRYQSPSDDVSALCAGGSRLSCIG